MLLRGTRPADTGRADVIQSGQRSRGDTDHAKRVSGAVSAVFHAISAEGQRAEQGTNARIPVRMS